MTNHRPADRALLAAVCETLGMDEPGADLDTHDLLEQIAEHVAGDADRLADVLDATLDAAATPPPLLDPADGINPHFDEYLRSVGLALTDRTALAYGAAVALGQALLDANRQGNLSAAVRGVRLHAASQTVETVAEYEHGSADWPCDPAVYVAAAVDLATILILTV